MNHLKQKLEDYTESEFLDFLNEFSANPRYQEKWIVNLTSTH